MVRLFKRDGTVVNVDNQNDADTLIAENWAELTLDEADSLNVSPSLVGPHNTTINENGVITYTPHVLDFQTEDLAVHIRAERDALLTACDWTQLPDSPLPAGLQAEWATYRQALRDITEQDGFPADVSWPVSPDEQTQID